MLLLRTSKKSTDMQQESSWVTEKEGLKGRILLDSVKRGPSWLETMHFLLGWARGFGARGVWTLGLICWISAFGTLVGLAKRLVDVRRIINKKWMICDWSMIIDFLVSFLRFFFVFLLLRFIFVASKL